MRSGPLFAAALLVMASAAPGCLSPNVRVIPSGGNPGATPRSSDCRLTFFRTKVDRPYDELSAIQVDVPPRAMFLASQEEVQKLVQAKACELGADAVLVTQDYQLHDSGRATMTGVAIKYRDAPGSPVDRK